MKRNTMFLVLSLIIVATMVLTACTPEPTVAPTEAPTEVVVTEAPTEVATEAPTAIPTPEPTTRHGGWADEVVFSVVDQASAVTQIEAGAIDIYGSGLSSKDLPAIQEAGLNYSKQNGLYYELTFNPVGPTFPATGKLNPFSDPKIREAMNMLLDRQYLNQEIYAGGALLKFFPITTQFPDYADLADVCKRLESKYAFNPEKANEIITAQMEAMGATLTDGKWTFNGEPVTIIMLIRNDSDGTRIPIGDYVANQLESIGFTVDRQYKKSSEASPLWVGGNPEDGLWHIYTGAWSATVIDRDQGDNFQFFYDPSSAYGFSALWQAYTPVPEYAELIQKLAYNQFENLEERRVAFARALELSMEDSVRIWLIDGKNFAPYADDIAVSYDLAAGIDGSYIWPHTLRFVDADGKTVEGGQIKWGTPDVLVDPWNPIAGTNWAFDNQVIRATGSAGLLPDPHTGLYWPYRIESATITAKEGLPIGQTLDWVTLEFVPEIKVPGDVFVDWDATTQTWITADTKFPEGTTAQVKSVAVYPADLWDTVKYHDGSSIDMADFMFSMIMSFDPAKPESAIYDEALAPNLDAFLANFKGFKIVSEDPLTVEYYTDAYSLDAEINVATLWPSFSYGEAPWHSLAVAALAEAAGETAFSADKADAAEIEWTNMIGGPSLEIMAKYLDQAIADSYIPYAPALGQYITADEAVARYNNLKTFYGEHGHFWVATGPYVLDKVFLTEKTVVLKSFADYADLSDRWNMFGDPKVAEVELDGAGQSVLGTDFTYDIFVTFEGEPYAGDEIKEVKVMLYDATGEIVYTGAATYVEDGQYQAVIPADTTKGLSAGASKVEIAVIPITVSIPTFASFEFVTVP